MTKQKALQDYLDANGLDIEVDMIHVGNLEMLCESTLQALQNGTPVSKAVKVIKK